MSGAPPYMVQAHKPGQFVQWVSDSRHDDLDKAIAAATTLHTQWKRTVRIMDQNEKVHFRLPNMRERRELAKKPVRKTDRRYAQSTKRRRTRLTVAEKKEAVLTAITRAARKGRR